MITKIKYFFMDKENNFTSCCKDTIEEIRKDIADYKKENSDAIFLIYKNEINNVFDKEGILIYSSDTIMREFDNIMEEENYV